MTRHEAIDLWDARNLTGLGREKVAATIGVTSKTIERWEKGVTPIKGYRLEQLAELYGVDPDRLVQRQNGQVAA